MIRLRPPRRYVLAWIALLVSGLWLTACTSALRTGTSAPAPTDTLSLLREAADHEALYTLAGGLKPMSSGIWRGSLDADDPDLREVEQVRAALAVLRNDTWYADVEISAKIYDGEYLAAAYVVHRASLARLIERHEAFWSQWDITPDTTPADLVYRVDRLPREDRWRAYGYLYGYPDAAVDFFVEAGRAAGDGREVGPGKDRQFTQIPTFAAATGAFTYAVPLGHKPSEEDQALADQAALILEAYTRLRSLMGDITSTMAGLEQLNLQFESVVRPEASGSPVRPPHLLISAQEGPMGGWPWIQIATFGH